MAKQGKKKSTKKQTTNKHMITDKRFKHAHYDPRFAAPPKNASKVQIDSRFQKMFSDKNFQGVTSTTDKRGKKIRRAEGDSTLQKFYEIEGGESVSDKLKRLNRLARGEGSGESSSSSSDSDSSLSDEEEENQDHEVSENGKVSKSCVSNAAATRRLALTKYNWENLSADDLYVLFCSFKPSLGEISSVKVYPSNYGLEKMKEEEKFGPQGLWATKNERKSPENPSNTSDSDDNFTENYDVEKLRQYEKQKLKYYFAVIECDSKETADHIYQECDGNEFEHSATVINLSFIPDDTNIPQKLHSESCTMPKKYEVPKFVTKALNHSSIDVTWEGEDKERQKVFNWHDKGVDELLEKDFSAFLASDDENDDKQADEMRKKYQRLLRGVNGDSDNDSRIESDIDKPSDRVMEMKFTPGLAAKFKKNSALREQMEDETVFQAYQRKKKERKKEKKRLMKAATKNDSDLLVDENDDFFVGKDEDPFAAWDRMGKESKRVTSKKEKVIPDDMSEDRRRENAELQLLALSENNTQDNPVDLEAAATLGANKKGKKNTRRKKKKKKERADDFQINVEDARFGDIYNNPEFAIDRTHAKFKKTKETEKLLRHMAVKIKGRKRKSGNDGSASTKKKKSKKK